MAKPIIMPKQGQSVESCVLLEWYKNKGDTVKKGDVLFSYETDKASFEFEAPDDGVLLDTFFEEQADIPVLTTVAVIGAVGEDISPFKPKVSSIVDTETPEVVSEPPVVLPQSIPTAPDASNVAGAVSPRARKTAEARGVDLSRIIGSGPAGRIIEQDVLAQVSLTPTAAARSIEEGLSAPLSGSGIGGRIRATDLTRKDDTTTADDTFAEVPFSNMRKIIGSRMMQSLRQSAQLTLNVFADATALLSYRKQVKARSKEPGLPDITINDLIALAVVRTLPSFPEINCLYRDGKVLHYDHVHLAMAVDTPRGLMVPVVKFANLLPLAKLSESLKEMVSQCREGSINPDLLTGGTFTISNLGLFGIDSFTPILNPPQVAILGVNAIAPRPVQTEDGSFAVRQHIGFSLTIDHQVVDGGPGARFLNALCEAIARIDHMLTV